MSNARYFADGADFWRVLYDDMSTEGPYFKAHAARTVGERSIKVRQRRDGSEYQIKNGYQIQKLTPLITDLGEPYLEWIDI